VGTPSEPFTGSFYGNGYSIKNLFINRGDYTTNGGVGLFGYTGSGGFITNVSLIDCNVTKGGDYPSDLVAHWKMDEDSWMGIVGEVKDSSGNTHHGTAEDGAKINLSGKLEHAGEFDGLDDHINCGNDSSLNPGTEDFTIMGWFKTKIYGENQTIIAKGGEGFSPGYYIRLNKKGYLNFLVMDDVQTQGERPVWGSFGTGKTNVTDDKWHFFCLTVFLYSDFIWTELYLDGNYEYSYYNSTSIGSILNNDNLTIGSYSDGSNGHFKGLIDDIRIYDRVLTSGNILDIYSGSGRYTGPLVGYNDGALIENCFTTGTVFGGTNTGGLAGYNNGTIRNSYSHCYVTGNYTIGGLVGNNSGIINCTYSIGNVTGKNIIGGLVGNNTGFVNNSFWDITASGQSSSGGGIGKNTTMMMKKSTFTQAGWYFFSIWKIKENFTYPYFQWYDWNDPPWITTINVENAFEDTEYSVKYTAIDTDYEQLYWTMNTNASWLSFNNITNILNGTPTNDDIGSYWVNITLEDGHDHKTFTYFTIRVWNTNDKPGFTSTPILTAKEDQLYTYDVNATDDDLIHGDVLTYSLTTAPANMTINSATGVISWTPVNEQVGDNLVVVRVSDTTMAFETQLFTITASNVNDGPYFISTPVTTATEDELYTYDVNAVDVDDGDVLKYSLNNKPDGMVIDNITGIITWTPTNDQVGIHNVAVKVSDLEDENQIQAFTITVENANDAPVMNKTGIPATATEKDFYSHDFEADDIDPTNDIFKWYLDTNGDDWLGIESSTGLLSGTPLNDHADKTYWVNVTVEDGNDGADWVNFTIYVNNVNDNPKITTGDVDTVKEGEPYYVDYNATDVDPTADTLIWDLDTNASDWLSIEKTTGVLSGTPGQDDTGSFWVKVSVKDGKGGTDFHNFTLIVKPKPSPSPGVNKKPAITTEDITTAEVNKSYYVDYDAVDDRTPAAELIWSCDTNATWLSFDFETAVLSGTPASEDSGTYYVKISVGDGEGGFDYRNFTITVPRPYVPPEPEEPKNNKPKLSDGKMTPTSGDTETEFTFSINYSDEDGDPPASITIVIDGIPYTMSKKGGENASDGIYEYKTTLTEGIHNYYFEANDSKINAEPSDTTPTVTEDAVITPEIIKTVPEEKKEEAEEEVNWLLFLIPIIIIIIVLAAVLMIRKKPSEDEGEAEEAEE
jgi:hypothetical protein